MKASQRAAQIWALLAWAATNRQVLTYDIVSKLIGVPRMGLGHLLEPIQSHCLIHDLPPLTILVVRGDSGMPGTGCIAQDIPRKQLDVFTFNWLDHGAPSPDELEKAVRERPSNANPDAANESDA